MIRVYPSRLEGAPIEVHETDAEMTLREWASINAPRMDLDNPPITIHINGKMSWLDDKFGPDDVVEIHIEPRANMIPAIIMLVIAVALYFLMPQPSMPRQQRSGIPLKSSEVSANIPRMGEPIPEILGTPPRHYPDMLVPKRTWYDPDDPKIQWADMFLCVGKGSYEKSLRNTYIGDTPIVSLGDDVSVTYYEPGDDLSGEPRARWWHTPNEVGFTSRGGSGMEVGTLDFVTPFRSTQVMRVENAMVMFGDMFTWTFPADWEAGMSVRLTVPMPATIVKGGERDRIYSDLAFQHFTPEPMTAVELEGDVEGLYHVHAYSPGTPGDPGQDGTPSSVTGSSPPLVLDYSTSPSAIQVESSTGTYVVYLSQAYSGVTGLVAAIASQLNGVGLTARVADGGAIAIEELSPYSGEPLSVSGPATEDVLGTDPVYLTGTPTTGPTPESGPWIELSYPTGLPVSDLPPGQHMISIGPEGMSYTLMSRSDYSVIVHTDDLPDFVGWTAGPRLGRDIVIETDLSDAFTGWTGPFAAAPPGELCDLVEVDIVFPQGLYRQRSSGRRDPARATVVVEWRELGTDDEWQRVTREIVESTADGLGYTITLPLYEPMIPEVRMSRVGAARTDKIINTFQWTSMRARMMGSPTSYQGVTTMAVRMRTGDRISAQADNKIWGVYTRILPLMDGTSVGPTRDLAPAFLHVLRTAGYGEDVIDMAELQRLHSVWAPRQDHFSYSAKTHSTIKTMCNQILRAGFAELTIDRGLITPVRDEPRSQHEYAYGLQEMTTMPTVTATLLAPDDIDGVDAEYLDATTGKMETVKYRLPGDLGVRAERIQLVGVTDYTRAYRLAARHRRAMQYRRTTISAETELQALNSRYMSFDLIQDGVPGYGQTAFVVEVVDPVTYRLSEPVDWSGDPPGAYRVIAFRAMDGKVSTPHWMQRGSDDYEVVLSVPYSGYVHLGGDGRDPTVVYTGRMEEIGHSVLVMKVTPKGNNRVSIDAIEYDPRVYEDDDWGDGGGGTGDYRYAHAGDDFMSISPSLTGIEIEMQQWAPPYVGDAGLIDIASPSVEFSFEIYWA